MVRSNKAGTPYLYEIWYQFPVVDRTVISAILIKPYIGCNKKPKKNQQKTANKSRKKMVELALAGKLQWRHNERDGVSNHQPHDYLLNRSFKRFQRKHQSSASLTFLRAIHRWPVLDTDGIDLYLLVWPDNAKLLNLICRYR